MEKNEIDIYFAYIDLKKRLGDSDIRTINALSKWVAIRRICIEIGIEDS